MRLLILFLKYHVLAIISLIKQTYYSLNTVEVDNDLNGVLMYMSIHTQQMNDLMSRLKFQYGEGRRLQHNWIQRSNKNYDIFSTMLDTQINDWNQLFRRRNDSLRTGTELETYYAQKTYKVLLNQTLARHEYSISRISESMPCSPSTMASSENVPVFKELCQLFQNLYSASIQETKHTFIRNARHLHQELLSLNATHIQQSNPVILSNLHNLWIQIPQHTVPFWYLHTATWYELVLVFIKFIVRMVCNIPAIPATNHIQLNLTI